MGAKRKLKRVVVHNQMRSVGVSQANKTQYNAVDRNGNAITVTRPSFFSQHWRDTQKTKKGGKTNAN